MKSITKICIITSGVFILLGIAGIGAGIAMGIKPSQLWELAHYTGPGFDKLRAEKSVSSDVSCEFSDIGSIDLDLSDCMLNIFIHEKDCITLEAANVRNTFQYSQEDGCLTVKDQRPDSWNQRTQSKLDDALKLTLYVPEQIFQKIRIRTDCSDITLDPLSAESIEISCGVGDLAAADLSGKNLYIDMGVGNLEADSVSVDKKTQIDMGTGNVILNQYEGGKLEIECGVGDADITAAGKRQDYNYELECGLGEIYLNHEPCKISLHHGEHKDGHEDEGCVLDIDNHSDHEIDIDCGLGNIELNFTEDT